MNLFRTAPDQHFLETVANFILQNFSAKLDKVKVIVPTRYVAGSLQKIIITEAGNSLLPDIVPYNSIVAGGAQIFDLPTSIVNPISQIEEKTLLAEIINNYQPLQYNMLQALKFAPVLAELFYTLNLNKIDIQNIGMLPTLNQAEHWKFIYNFLSHAHNLFQQKLTALNKTGRCTYQLNILAAEKERAILDKDGHLIIAGLFGENKTAWSFFKDVMQHNNNYLILPPLPVAIEKALSINSTAIDNFYALRQLLSHLEKNITDFQYLTIDNPQSSVLDSIISDISFITATTHDIEYIEALDPFEEAEIISLICKKFENKKIAIIISSDAIKENYIIALKKHDLKFHDVTGDVLINSNVCQMIIAISDLVCNSFDLRNLFILLKNSLIYSEEILNLEKLLLGKNRFANSYQQVTQIVVENNDQALTGWWQYICSVLNIELKLDFTSILTANVEIAEKLLPTIWDKNKHGAEEIAILLADIIEGGFNPALDNMADFPAILKILIDNTKIFVTESGEENIIICYPHEVTYLKFDIVILTGFNQGSFPPDENINPWLNKEMQKTLDFYPEHIKTSSYLYNFYLLLHNKKIFITRSKKQGAGELLPSNYLYKLQYVIPSLVPSLAIASKSQDLRGDPEIFDHSENFYFSGLPSCLDRKLAAMVNADLNKNLENECNLPKVISATDIELLVRNPYGFYIKKILGLRKIEEINAPPKLSEFGNFIHSIMEEYSKNYSQDISDKSTYILKIAGHILDDLLLPDHTRQSWLLKFKAIADEFIEFDERRRIGGSRVFAEITGTMKYNILGNDITIMARADRVEIDKEGYISILDYKTGALPTKKEVQTGLSPQLIISALIAQSKGFEKINQHNKIRELIYVKIASTKPYIQTVSFSFSEMELMQHKQGLLKLLEYYMKTGNFPQVTNLIKYNDYKHFMRMT